MGSCHLLFILVDFTSSRIKDGVRCKMLLFKVSKFLPADFLIFPGKAFRNRTPDRENEFFSCSRREDMTQNLLVVADHPVL